MRENQLTVQNQILSLLKSEELNEKQADHFTAAWLAQKLNYSRNFISQLLNDLTEQRLCVKINTRPVYYFSGNRTMCLIGLSGETGAFPMPSNKRKPRLPIRRKACLCF